MKLLNHMVTHRRWYLVGCAVLSIVVLILPFAYYKINPVVTMGVDNLHEVFRYIFEVDLKLHDGYFFSFSLIFLLFGNIVTIILMCFIRNPNYSLFSLANLPFLLFLTFEFGELYGGLTYHPHVGYFLLLLITLVYFFIFFYKRDYIKKPIKKSDLLNRIADLESQVKDLEEKQDK